MEKMKKIQDSFTGRHYRTEEFLITILLVSLFKMALFSLGIQAPETDLRWRFISSVVFIVANSSVLLVLLLPVFFMGVAIFSCWYFYFKQTLR